MNEKHMFCMTNEPSGTLDKMARYYFEKINGKKDGLFPFVCEIDETISAEESAEMWEKSVVKKLFDSEELSMTIECKSTNPIRDLFELHKFDQVYEKMDNGLSAKEYIELMKQATFGDNTIVQFIPKKCGEVISIIVGRGSARTHPVIAETNIGTFVFSRPYQFGTMNVDALVDVLMPPIVPMTEEEEAEKQIKLLKRQMKYEKNPLRMKQLQRELNEAKRSLKRCRNRKTK